MDSVDKEKDPTRIDTVSNIPYPIYLAGEIRQFKSNFLLLKLSDLSYIRSSEQSIELGTEESTVGQVKYNRIHGYTAVRFETTVG